MARTLVSSSTFTETDGNHPAGFTDLCDGSGQVRINGNKFHSPFGFPADSRDNGTFSTTQYAQIVLSGFSGVGNTDEVGVILLFAADVGAGRDGYRVYIRDGSTKSLIVEKIVNAGISNLRTDTSESWANTDVLSAEADPSAGSSTTIKLFRNGTQVGADVVDGTTPHTTGKPGIYAKQGSSDTLRGDDYEAGNGALDGGGGGGSPTLMGQAIL
jgi:hypothetical protein